MFKMILFDVDGVLLSEERYFDASALTVWEMLFNPKYLGLNSKPFTPEPTEDRIRSIRNEIFVGDEVLALMKNRGINGNWDMVYLSFAHQLICVMEQLLPDYKEDIGSMITSEITLESLIKLATMVQGRTIKVSFNSFISDFVPSIAQKQDLLLYLNHLAEVKLGVTTQVFSGTSKLWELCQETFQEWYLGDELVQESIGRGAYQTGKKGFLSDEIPILEPKRIASVLAELQKRGIILGIGTGRPTIETLIPLEELGLLPYFDANRVITASHVLDAEAEFPDRTPLGKPQPFCYIKGWLGLEKSNQEVLNTTLPLLEAEQLLVVGDSIADYMAAKSIGCRFAATLTGLAGQEARVKFEELQADYILNDMSEILSIFDQK